MVKFILHKKDMNFDISSAVLFIRKYGTGKICLKDMKTTAYFVNSPFKKVCFIPLDENGRALLQLIGDVECMNMCERI